MRLYLRILSGLQIGDEVTLDPPGGMIGRSDGALLCIRDASLSRTHLELRFVGNAWWAVQRSTRSSTIVDGQLALDRPLPLGHAGTLQLGNVSLEYRTVETQPVSEPAVPRIDQSPATMINIRPQLSAIQHAVKTQLSPLRPPEPAPSQAPATLILRRSDSSRPEGPPPLPATVPPPIPATESPVAESNLRAEVERWQKEAQTLRQKTAQLEIAIAEERRQRDELRREYETLQAEVLRLRTSLVAAQENPGIPEHRAITGALPQQALALLSPFSESLEQASDALRDGDAVRARSLIRDASFGLADLRDLFETAA